MLEKKGNFPKQKHLAEKRKFCKCTHSLMMIAVVAVEMKRHEFSTELTENLFDWHFFKRKTRHGSSFVQLCNEKFIPTSGGE